MFVPPEQRSIPPRREPPRRSPDSKRKENAAVALIVLISAMALFAPVGGGTFLALAFALFGH